MPHAAPDDTVTIPQIIDEIGIPLRTLQRKTDELLAVGAVKTGQGWRIPKENVPKLKNLILSQRTPNATPKSMPNVVASHMACQERETELTIQLARSEAIIEQLQQRVDRLESTQDKLLSQVESVTAANAALAMTMRETSRSIEITQPQTETVQVPTNDKATPDDMTSSATHVDPHPTVGKGLRGRFKRFAR